MYRGTLDVDDPMPLLLGERVPREPLVVTRAMGNAKCADVIWSTWSGVCFVSARLVKLLQLEKFTGWQTYPVQVIGEGGQCVADYFGLSVTGRCGPLQDERSHRIQKPRPVGPTRPVPGNPFEIPSDEVAKQPTLRYLVGWYFFEESWDGSDFFVPKQTSAIIVTEQVKQAFQRSAVVRFDRLDQIEELA